MNLILPCLLAFLIALAIDWSYAHWMLAISDQRALRACLYSAVCSLLGFLALWVFVDWWFTAGASAVGHAVGTLLAMNDHRRFREEEKRLAAYEQLYRSHYDFPEEV